MRKPELSSEEGADKKGNMHGTACVRVCTRLSVSQQGSGLSGDNEIFPPPLYKDARRPYSTSVTGMKPVL